MSDPVTLNDLFVACCRCDGTGWQDGCSHGAYSMVAHVVDCGSRQVWPCPTHQPLTESQLIQVLEGMGAKRQHSQWSQHLPHTGFIVVEPGSYLVLPLEGQNSTENGTVLPLPTPQEEK